MALELDDRQRAMLLEMGVRVWLPGTAFAVEDVQSPGATERRAPPVALSHTGSGNGDSEDAVPWTGAVPRSGASTAPPVIAPVAPVAAFADAGSEVPDLSALNWTALHQTAAQCRACGLCAGRKHTTLQAPADIAGASPKADWMVVGDQPDEDEDAAGSPFADASGVLLANMLKALGLVRINSATATAAPPARAAYVTNIVKCRAPHGAVPQAAELAQCAAYLQREIAMLQPKMIFAMGRFANQLLLSETPELVNMPLGKVRGSVYRYQGVPVVVTYHPKFLMRNSADKAKAWADLCLAADTLDGPSG